MKKTKFNILFIGFVPYVSGAEISTLLLLKYLNGSRFDPVYMIPGAGPLLDRINEIGVKTEIMALERIKLPFPAEYLAKVRENFRRQQ